MTKDACVKKILVTRISFSNIDLELSVLGKFSYKDFCKEKDKLLLTMEPVIIDNLCRLTEKDFPSAIYGERKVHDSLVCKKESKLVFDRNGKGIVITFSIDEIEMETSPSSSNVLNDHDLVSGW